VRAYPKFTGAPKFKSPLSYETSKLVIVSPPFEAGIEKLNVSVVDV
jgi:hypothetical protein